ncbi:thioredoxin domain-containing protein [Heyndrickxia coagulans]|uniref:Thymidylate kinase n=1 Tax=Heyndrickxia coagulans TaxID=1398 RepID=A0A150K801_HEYCO|nr:thioredoxin domain-containing protein [Heyndrickxia coagulans]KYC65536.1 Thymidylate kinase [Heyndrickxia coagulans]
MGENRPFNRLIHEKSPYLLQHARNPVDWYPWGEDAFAKAKRENKPVFVSIGYSTCHWCHVMERESFENEEVARILNEKFVAIKVDREERPDIDAIYMLVCQMMTGQGGWPLSVFLTPEKVPFYAGTYFPRESRYGMPGFKEVLHYLSQQYTENPDRIKDVGTQVKQALEASREKGEQTALTKETTGRAFQTYKQAFDPRYGGFGKAPKFPMPHSLVFLLMYAKFYENRDALAMATKTLDGLARGGIYDHIGYGFSRYSVDEKFLVPHFEKMLYDNALLALAYTDAFRMTKNARYKKITEEIIKYVLRDMAHPDGGFYSAEDADSEGEEGKFYVWTPKEVKDVLGEQLGTLFCQAYGITGQGNFEGKNIPNQITTHLETIAKKEGISPAALAEKLETARQSLFQHREKRVRPFRDDKILTAWNGLMIAALAKAGRVFYQPSYVQAAEKAVSFIRDNLIQNGRVMVRYRDGEVKNKGFIDEYAFLLWGYMELYESTFAPFYLAEAKRLAGNMIDLFWDGHGGGFFFSGNDDEPLLVRQKESYDGALPSGNSVAACQLLRLAKLTGDFTLEEKVQQMFQAFSKVIHDDPNAHAMMMQAVMYAQQATKEVVIVMDDETEKAVDFIRHIQENFHPEISFMAVKRREKKKLSKIAPFIEDYAMINGQPTIYVCENFSCNQPTNDFQTARDLLFKK